MAIATLHETLISYALRKSALTLKMSELNDQKTLALGAQADQNSLLASGKHSIRDKYKKIFEEDPTLRAKYSDYTEIPEFEEEIEKLQAEFQDKIDELSAWETEIDTQITTCSAELKEIEAFEQSYKSMLQSNISNDFNYGLNS